MGVSNVFGGDLHSQSSRRILGCKENRWFYDISGDAKRKGVVVLDTLFFCTRNVVLECLCTVSVGELNAAGSLSKTRKSVEQRGKSSDM